MAMQEWLALLLSVVLCCSYCVGSQSHLLHCCDQKKAFVAHLQSLGGGRTLFPIIKIGLYNCPEMLFRGSYSLLLVLYSTAVINLNCLLVFFFNSCFHVLLAPKRTKRPGTEFTSRIKLCSRVASNIPRSFYSCRCCLNAANKGMG